MTDYRTTDMSACAYDLSQAYRHVIVRHRYYSYKPIRFWADSVQSKLAKWLPDVISAHKPRTLTRWEENGGLLVDATKLHKSWSPTECDALLVAESPWNTKALFEPRIHAREVRVFYQPPTWELHRETFEIWHPPMYASERAHDFLNKRSSVPLDDRQRWACEAAGWPTIGVAVLTDAEVEKGALLPASLFKGTRKAGFWTDNHHGWNAQYHTMVNVFRPRFRPAEEHLAVFWDMINDLPPCSTGERMCKPSTFDGVMGFKKACSQMFKMGAVERCNPLHLYTVLDLRNQTAIMAKRKAFAQEDMEKVFDYVDSLPVWKTTGLSVSALPETDRLESLSSSVESA